MTSIRRKAHGRDGERGSELIEFMIVFPLLLLIVSGIVDFGFLFRSYEVVTNAAREGARIGILPNYSTADVESRVATYLTAAGLTKTPTTTVGQVTVTLASGKTVSVYQVRVIYPHTFSLLAPIASYFGGTFGTIYVSGVSAMRQEMPAS